MLFRSDTPEPKEAEAVEGLDASPDGKWVPETVTLCVDDGTPDGKAVATLPYDCLRNSKLVTSCVEMERHGAGHGDRKDMRIKIKDTPEHAIRDAATLLDDYKGAIGPIEAKQPRRSDIPGACARLLEPYERTKQMTKVRDLVMLAHKMDEPVLLNHTCAFVATAIRGLLPGGIEAVLWDRMTPEEARAKHDGLARGE